MSKSSASDWRVDHSLGGIGARLIQARLEESIAHLDSQFHVAVPPLGRHQQAVAVLREWNNAEGSIDLTNCVLLESLAEAHRLAWETYLIVAAAIEDRRTPATCFTPDKLRMMVGGDLVKEGRDGSARDTQFELYVGAILRLPGLSVFRGEPDLQLMYGTERVGVAVKRVRSTNNDQVQKRARSAARQIEQQQLRGWVALNLDTRFAVVDYSQPEERLLREFESAFDAVGAALQRAARKPHVLGFFLIGHVHSWHPPIAGTSEPRLHWAAPIRWFGLVEARNDAEFFRTFVDSWATRWRHRTRSLTDPNFTGLL